MLSVFWHWQHLVQSIVWPTSSPITHHAAWSFCDSWATCYCPYSRVVDDVGIDVLSEWNTMLSVLTWSLNSAVQKHSRRFNNTSSSLSSYVKCLTSNFSFLMKTGYGHRLCCFCVTLFSAHLTVTFENCNVHAAQLSILSNWEKNK